jgi:hypothetical protein
MSVADPFIWRGNIMAAVSTLFWIALIGQNISG